LHKTAPYGSGKVKYSREDDKVEDLTFFFSTYLVVVVCLTRDVVLLLPPQTTCQDIKTQTQTSGEQTVIKYTM
jgi:hypothetical protein